MADAVTALGGGSVLVRAAAGPAIATEGAAADLVGDALGRGVDWVLVPAERLAEEFFESRSGLAGAVARKFVNSRLERRLEAGTRSLGTGRSR